MRDHFLDKLARLMAAGVILAGVLTISAMTLGETQVIPPGVSVSNNLSLLPASQVTRPSISYPFGVSISTDLPNYHPGDTVQITGSGFNAGETVVLQVTHTESLGANGLLDPPHQGHDPWSVVADTNGNVTAAWIVDEDALGQVLRLTADGSTSGAHAETTFRDGTGVDFRQCANKDNPFPLGRCHWINAIVQSSDARYFEGMSVDQRIILTDITPTPGDSNIHRLTLTHEATKGGIHGYDFLTSYEQGIAFAASFISFPPFLDTTTYTQAPGESPLANLTFLTTRACGDEIGPPNTLGATCTGVRNGVFRTDVPLPDDPYVDTTDGSVQQRINAYEAAFGNRYLRIYSDAAITNAQVILLGHTGADTGDSDVNYIIQWTGTASTVLIEVGGHLSVSGADATGTNWGPGQGSAQINGGPYHFSLKRFNTDASGNGGESLGSQDNQVKGADILIPSNPNLAITKTADAATVSAGSPIGFTITVTNNGDGPANGTTLNDSLPAGSGVDWSIASQSGGANCVINGAVGSEVLSCGPVNLAAGASFSVHVTSPTNEFSCADYPNTATAQATNNAAVQAQTSTTVQCPSLSITKTPDAATVSAGSPIGFTITVTNNGPGTANAVTLNDPLPAGGGVDWGIASQSGGASCVINGNPPTETLACGPINLASGASFSVHVTSGTTSASCQAYPNTATADATNHAAVQASATTTVQCPSLAIVKTADAASVSAGSTIGFTITVTNNGPGTANSVTLSDPLPAGGGVDWGIASQSGGANCVINGNPPTETLACGPINLASGASFSVHVTSATTSASCQAYPNTATAQATNHATVQSSATTTVLCSALAITKTADAAVVSAGSQIGFTITVTNNGAGTANAVTLSDPLPAGSGVDWSIASQAGGANCVISGAPPTETLACGPINLAQGASFTVHVVSATTELSCANYPNTATAQATNNAQIQASASVLVQCPNLGVTKVADAATVSAGSPIGFTITVTNAGPGTASAVTLNDALPAGSGVDWSIASQAGGAGCVINGNPPTETLVCGPINLASGGSFSVHVTSATTEFSCANYPNVATADASNAPPLTAQASVLVQCPSLAITKTPDAATVSAGSTIGFTITVTNNGPGTATGVTLNDPLPAGAGVDWGIASQAGGAGCVINGNPPSETLVCGPIDLPSGGSFTVHVTSGTTEFSCANYPNAATADATNSAPVQATASVLVQCPNLGVTKVADAASVSAGSTIGFTITVTNPGPGTANAVTLNDPLPNGSGVNWSIASQSGGAGCVINGAPPAQTLACGPINLASGGTFSVHVTSGTTELSCANYPNTATADATNSAPVQAQASTTVQCPDLQIAKTAANSPINAGQVASFTITVSNPGPGVATNVVMSDPLPPGVPWAITGGTGAAACVNPIVGNTLSCSFGNMAAGSSFTVIVSGLTDAADCGTLPNTATADSDNDAPVHASASIVVRCGRLIVDKVTVPSGDPTVFQFGGSLTFGLADQSPVFNSGPIAPGIYSAGETTPTGWILTSATCSDGSDPAAISIDGNETVTCVFTNSKLPTLVLRKVIQGQSTQFSFVVNGNPTNPPNTNINITPPTNGEASSPSQIIQLGNYSATETPIPQSWVLTDASCVSDQGGFVTDNTGLPVVTFTARYGDDIVCSFFDNQQLSATRTQGFWATHTVLTNAIWNGTPLPAGTSNINPTPVIGSPDQYLCQPPTIIPPFAGVAITAIPAIGQNQVLGGFWSGIPKKSAGGRRSSLDQVRMQFLQQYLAAVLNVHAFGSPIGTTTLAQARAAYCGTDENAIQTQKNLLAAYNEGGDTAEFTPGVNATTKDSKLQANIPFWDTTFR